MARLWCWVLVGLVAACLVGAWLWHRVSLNKKAANGRLADLADLFARPKIDAQALELRELRKNLAADQNEIRKREIDIQQAWKSLAERYQALELTPEEIEIRTRDLRL